jgi:raffinose/stachyose/melibiose transport system permease protein
MESEVRREHAVEKFGARKVIIYVILVLWALLNLFPVYWMFTFSLKSNEEIFGKNLIGLPWEWRWSNYVSAWHTGNMPLYFLNSVVVSVSAIALVIIASMMATYAMTRLTWKWSAHVNAFFMLGLTIPIHASIVPVYVTLKNMGLTNTYWALIFPYAAFSLAMGILICTGFMVEIPKELDEAARIDGCGPWKTFGVVILPLMKPATATISIYSFLQCWNELMFANIFNSDGKYRTLPVGVQQLSGQYTTEWGPIGAALVIATFPMLIVYIFMSKRIQESFVVGAVKG